MTPVAVFKDVFAYLDAQWTKLGGQYQVRLSSHPNVDHPNVCSGNLFAQTDALSNRHNFAFNSVCCIVVGLQAALCRMPLVPVGNRLAPASRLYFRLNEDVAPFMFEM